MKPLRYVGVEHPPESVRPMGDFVLVRPCEPDMETYSGLLEIPENARQPDRGLRMGVVVATGPGDQVAIWICPQCGGFQYTVITSETDNAGRHHVVYGAPGKCDGPPFDTIPCGGEFELIGTSRAPMFCSVGETVLYPRVPANVVRINGEELIFLHEEQHVLAVLEPELQPLTKDVVSPRTLEKLKDSIEFAGKVA